ncbi:MAG: aminopeptidase N [Bdellovibrionales bacterium]
MSSASNMYLKDYRSPAYEVSSIHLDFDLHEERTRVVSTIQMRRLRQEPLALDGEDLTLISCELDGKPADYRLTPTQLILESVPESFQLRVVTEINPSTNTALQGLYLSRSLLTTQCEAQGFRRMTFFLDRPDVMTVYTVSITADQKKYPVLLSNGDLVQKEKLVDGKHRTVWKDPFKKPSYLFALVAGDLGVLRDTFTTQSGKLVNLEIYGPHGKQNQCEFAMQSLKKAMRWDEQAFGREYDLNTYMIVAVEDANMGAMENKGLNIFNAALVFADKRSATDTDYLRIESVVAHEYFHNWTGNRITCRDWFHLSLKEGLTVYRDQEFSSDTQDRSVQRIQDVEALRTRQFPEDAGPNAHPVRPDFGASMDNFYTSTIYEKGSEVIRMMKNLVGARGFRKGMDLYFERHDGQAVTIEEFVQAISDANKIDLTQFKLWYHQAGTPQISVRESFDQKQGTYTVELTQRIPPTPNQTAKKPHHIPLIFGLLDSKGHNLSAKSSHVTTNSDGDLVFELKQETQSFVFSGLREKPVLSLNRQFSAPVNVKWRRSADELLHLLKYDSDGFNRREALVEVLFHYFDGYILEGKTEISPELIQAYRHILQDASLSASLKAELLTFPADSLLAQRYEVLDPERLETAKNTLILALAQTLRWDWKELYDRTPDSFGLTPEDFGRRKLKRWALNYWARTEDPQAHALVSEMALTSPFMGLRCFGLQTLCNQDASFKTEALEKFRWDWGHDSLIMNKWFMVQATSTHPKTFANVVKLTQDPLFEMKNPNKVSALIGAFGRNIFRFYDLEQKPYRWLSEKIVELDKINPQVAARLCDVFNFVPRLRSDLKEDIQKTLEPLKSQELSKNTHELLQKI